MNKLIDRALEVATFCFAGRTDLNGDPYIMHLLRVAMNFQEDPELFAIAILHDLLEDIKGGQDVLNTFPPRVIKGVTALTKTRSYTYIEYISKVSENKDAILVKMKDIEDNINVLRLYSLNGEDLSRVEKYHTAYRFLAQKLEELNRRW